MVEIYPRDVFQLEATGMAGAGEGEGGDAALHPLDPESLVKKVISAKDRSIFHPAPMEGGVAGVQDAKVWARVQATVREREASWKREREGGGTFDFAVMWLVVGGWWFVGYFWRLLSSM